VLVIGIGFLLRLALAPVYGLTYNETYVVVLSRHLSLSYVDHPPLAMWLVAAARFLTGSESDVIVRLPFILLFAGTTWLIYDLGRSLFSAMAGFYAALALNLSPMFSLFMGVFAVTDGPMLFFLVLATWLLQRALFQAQGLGAFGYWLATGAATGAAMLSKYNAAFFGIGAVLFILTQPAYRHWLLRPAPYLGAVLAFLIFSPVLIWNAQHDWISLAFQGSRALPEGGIKPVRVLAYLGITALYMLPWIWFGLIVVFFTALRAGPKDVPRWFLFCLSAAPIIFFTVVRIFANRADKGYHWAVPGYVMLFPLLGAAYLQWRERWGGHMRRLLIASYVTIAVVLIGIVSHSYTGWMRWTHPRFAERDPLITDQFDWTDLRSILSKHGFSDPAKNFVVGHRWQDCIKLDYALQGRMPIVCMTQEPLQLSFFEQQAPMLGRDAVIVSRNWPLDYTRRVLGTYFESIEPLDTVVIGQHGLPTLKLNLFIGRKFKTTYPWPYGKGIVTRPPAERHGGRRHRKSQEPD